MKEIEIEELIVDYLDGKLEYDKLKDTLLKSGKYKLDDIEKIKSLYCKLDDIPVPEPGENLDKNFYNLLEPLKSVVAKPESRFAHLSSKLSHIINLVTLPKLGYASLFIVLGIFIGKWLIPGNSIQLEQMSAEVKQMKEVMMLTMLNQPSPSERIKAVSSVNSISNSDSKVINALIETLNNDPDVNVRLVTVEALSGFTQNPQVRQGLIQSIAKQKSPLVQIALADLMVSLREKNSVEPLKDLLKDKGISYAVKNKIEACIAKI